MLPSPRHLPQPAAAAAQNPPLMNFRRAGAPRGVLQSQHSAPRSLSQHHPKFAREFGAGTTEGMETGVCSVLCDNCRGFSGFELAMARERLRFGVIEVRGGNQCSTAAPCVAGRQGPPLLLIPFYGQKSSNRMRIIHSLSIFIQVHPYRSSITLGFYVRISHWHFLCKVDSPISAQD